MSFQRYLDVVSGNFRKAVKVEWLNPDESVNFEFTNALYDINVDLSVNYQNGSRRTCTLTLNNDRNQFPVDFNNIWFGQKFKLWMGIYIDEKTPYYFPQGVFYISNPNEAYQPSTRTIKINGVDKWAFLDGTLHGKLSGTYQTNIGNDLIEATKELLALSKSRGSNALSSYSIMEYFEESKENGAEYGFVYDGSKFVSENSGTDDTTASIILTAKRAVKFTVVYSYATESQRDFFTLAVNGKTIENAVSGVKTNKTLDCVLSKGQSISFKYSKDFSNGMNGDECSFQIYVVSSSDMIDPTPPFISPCFLTKTSYVLNTDSTRNSSKTYYEYKDGEYTEYKYTTPAQFEKDYSTLYTEELVKKCPYTAKVERGKTYADVLLEYATILCAHIYYDANGRLTIEPMTDEADDITDTNKEIVWHFTIEEKQLLGLNTTYNFDKVYNDIIVLGNVVNGYQFKARVQNRNLMSNTCVQKIGLKTKDPLEDNQYYSDEQCKELAMYYAKVDTILQKSGDISSTPLYHLDVNKLATVSTPNNNMSKESFLITGYTLNSSDSMAINVTSVNVLKDFSVVEAEVYE